MVWHASGAFVLATACSSHSAYESGASGGAGGALAGAGGNATAGSAGTAGAGGSEAGAGGTNGAGSAGTAGTGTGAGIERIAASTTLTTDGPTLTLGLPSSLALGDLVLIALYLDNGQDANADLIDPLGFTMTSALVAQSCGSFVVWYGHRIVAAGDPDSYEFTFSADGSIQGATAAFVVYRGADPGNPFAGQAARGLEQASFPMPELGQLDAGATVLAIFVDGFNGGGGWQPPPGMTELFDIGLIGAFETTLETAGASPVGEAQSENNGCGTVFASALVPG